MPLYEYECENGHRFEKIQKFSDPPLEACERCGAPARKLMSSPAIQFKGTGWYITDYAQKGKSGGSSEGKAEAKKDGSAEGKSESKGTDTSGSGASEGTSKSTDSGTKTGSTSSSKD